MIRDGHIDKAIPGAMAAGTSRILPACLLPLTGKAFVDLIVTDLAVLFGIAAAHRA